MVRRLGEENEDVAIIIDRGADVALLFPLSMADHGEGELPFSTKTKLPDAQKKYPHRRCEKR